MSESGSYSVHYLPPDYPDKLFPRSCRHRPEYKMLANLKIARKRGKNEIEIDHHVCFACGLSLPATFGGNVLVDLSMILATAGRDHWKFASRAHQLRSRWTRIALHLFDENGWNGRHERIARLIDPRLTMKLALSSQNARLGKLSFDQEYIRPCDEEASDGDA